MFTGIIKEIGTLKKIVKRSGILEIEISSDKIIKDAYIDDSIAVNGVCLTVVNKDRDSFTVQAVKETAERTNILKLFPGERVNLEPALRPDGRMGGHIVQGHIDGKGEITSIDKLPGGREFIIKTDHNVMKYIVEKGSVCLDGISLTVSEVKKDIFRVSIIPHTLNVTTAGEWRQGKKINIETDIVGRYVEKFTGRSGELTFDKLKEMGY